MLILSSIIINQNFKTYHFEDIILIVKFIFRSMIFIDITLVCQREFIKCNNSTSVYSIFNVSNVYYDSR